MNMIRISHHDLSNPAKRIAELESELLRVRADAMALSKFSRQHERERDEYKYQRDVITDALRARPEAAELDVASARLWGEQKEKDAFALAKECKQLRAAASTRVLAGVPDAGNGMENKKMDNEQFNREYHHHSEAQINSVCDNCGKTYGKHKFDDNACPLDDGYSDVNYFDAVPDAGGALVEWAKKYGPRKHEAWCTSSTYDVPACSCGYDELLEALAAERAAPLSQARGEGETA